MDRRSFLVALGSALLPSAGKASSRGARETIFVSACSDASGAASVAAFEGDGRLRFSTRLPARGHDIAQRPGSNELVVFARRPGDWAAVVELPSGTVRQVVIAPSDRHFYGHGVFSADGAILLATENAMTTGSGVLGLYDAGDGYRRIGEVPSHGIGPHDLALAPGSSGIVVANGGIRTHPATGREILNPEAMEPSLAIVDPRSGDALSKVDLGAGLRGLSIRHLAVSTSGKIVFGCQFEGDATELPPLVGVLWPGGRTRFLDMPEDDLAALENYVGSVSVDASGRFLAATSPRGNTAAFWDLASNRYLGRKRMGDVCGVAPDVATEAFVMTSGNNGVRVASMSKAELTRLGGSDLDRWVWDNHLTRFDGQVEDEA